MLNEKIHGVLDYITVIIFALAPSVFALSHTGAIICYVLAVVHLLMTILTGFSLSLIKVISFPFHGLVELVVGLVLAIVPWFLDSLLVHADQLFFGVMGIIILFVWLLTNYTGPLAE